MLCRNVFSPSSASRALFRSICRLFCVFHAIVTGDAGLSECCANPVRRALLLLAGSQPLFSLLASSEASVALTPSGLRADLPMRRIRLPQGAVGRDYVVVQLKIAGKGPFDFMVDSGLTGELITPHLQVRVFKWDGRGSQSVCLLARCVLVILEFELFPGSDLWYADCVSCT